MSYASAVLLSTAGGWLDQLTGARVLLETHQERKLFRSSSLLSVFFGWLFIVMLREMPHLTTQSVVHLWSQLLVVPEAPQTKPGQQNGKHFCSHLPYLSIPRLKTIVPNLTSRLASGEPAGEGRGEHPVLVLVLLALGLSFILPHRTASRCPGRVARGRRWRKEVLAGAPAAEEHLVGWEPCTQLWLILQWVPRAPAECVGGSGGGEDPTWFQWL